jgi:hypothetical protein
MSEKPPRTDDQLAHLITKDELNLCEFPFTLLSDRAPAGVKTMRFTDTIRRANGISIERKWTISGGDAYGLPTASDEPVYLALMEIAKKNQFKSPRIEFTVYEILKRLGMPDDGRSYRRLRASLLRLNSVTITADSSFYDVVKKEYKTVYSFHILEAFCLAGGRGSRQKSFVRFSNELWHSIESGAIKSLDFSLYLSLTSAIARRLFRYLDKVAYDGKPVFSIGLRKLAFEHLGLSRNYYPSDIKRLLKPAHEELIEMGFLGAVDSRPGKEDEVMVYRFRRVNTDLMQITEELTGRGMTLSAARKIVKEYPGPVIREQIEACDRQKPKNAGAWLRTAITEGYVHDTRQPEPQRELFIDPEPAAVTDDEFAKWSADYSPEELDTLRDEILEEVRQRPIFKDKPLGKGMMAMVESQLREVLRDRHQAE